MYHLFVGDYYEYACGMDNYAGSFDSIEAAQVAFENRHADQAQIAEIQPNGKLATILEGQRMEYTGNDRRIYQWNKISPKD